ncbi:hypothetical protein PIB30_057330 [Stylosanthes scabra]|uniref:Uncharacterized protein n=1 Tax=Stylosanthes scabra TaxID=79078 RepID=A0ABU6SKJ9_9FABA|nr:hypothetical protein [Stylosanthes scabra]
MSYGCFVFSKFLSFQERSSLEKGQESSSMRLNEGVIEVDRSYGRSKKGDSKLEDALRKVGMEDCA